MNVTNKELTSIIYNKNTKHESTNKRIHNMKKMIATVNNKAKKTFSISESNMNFKNQIDDVRKIGIMMANIFTGQKLVASFDEENKGLP